MCQRGGGELARQSSRAEPAMTKQRGCQRSVREEGRIVLRAESLIKAANKKELGCFP